MATNNKSDDQVDKITRDEKARIDSDLLNGSLGDRDIQASRSRTNRGRSILVRNEILQKQKEKDEDARREAFKRAQEALLKHLDELDKLIAEMNRKIEKNEKEMQTIEERLEREFGKDWKERFERGELDSTHFLYQQWFLRQKQSEELKKSRDELIHQRDHTKKLLERAEAKDITLLEELQANEAARHGQNSNTKIFSEISDAQEVTKLEENIGITDKTIKRSLVIKGDVNDRALDSLFDEEPSTIAFSKTIEKSTIKGPPVAQQFAKASDPNQTELQTEINAKAEVNLKNPNPAS